ncbi:MAG: hypothetical protein ACI853_001744, partial [Paracoccaceae bacterium]
FCHKKGIALRINVIVRNGTINWLPARLVQFNFHPFSFEHRALSPAERLCRIWSPIRNAEQNMD